MTDFCSRAMPYIKAALTDDSGLVRHLGHGDSAVIRDLRNGLLVLYVVDTGQSLEFVQNRHLCAEGIKEDELHALALNNFLAFMAEKTRMQPHGSICALFLDGNFEASLLLVDQLWNESLVSYAPAGFVVAVPARDVLAFADASSAQGIEELRGLIDHLFPDGDHLISSELYRREAGQWVVDGG